MNQSVNHQPPAPESGRSPHLVKSFLAGSLMFAFVGLLVDFRGMAQGLHQAQAQTDYSSCETIVQEDARLSRDQLLKLLAISERDPKEKVREVMAEPFCTLSTVEIRAGVKAEREAYPLEFDPAVKLVLLYEDNEYAGYRFSFE